MTNREWIEAKLGEWERQLADAKVERGLAARHTLDVQQQMEAAWLQRLIGIIEYLISALRVALAIVDKRHFKSEFASRLKTDAGTDEFWCCACGCFLLEGSPCPVRGREEQRLAEALGKQPCGFSECGS